MFQGDLGFCAASDGICLFFRVGAVSGLLPKKVCKLQFTDLFI